MLLGNLAQRDGFARAGARVKDVDLALLPFDCVEQAVEVVEIGRVAAHAGYVPADQADGLVERILFPARDEDVGAFFDEPPGGRQGHAARSACDDRYLAFKLSHDFPFVLSGGAVLAQDACPIFVDHRSRYGFSIRITDPFVKATMRADARKNYDHLLAVAREVVTEHGVNASMRDIARRAEVGLATLLRHFPTRESLFEALLCMKADALTQRAAELETSSPPDEALVSWFREAVEFTHTYGGVCDLMASAHADPDSALHASSTALHDAGARLLLRAQTEGTARADIDGVDLFALMSALGWLVDQPSFAPRADHLVRVITNAIMTKRPSSVVKKATNRRR